MQLKKLNFQSDAEFSATWAIYESSFPFDERQEKVQQAKRFALKTYQWLAVIENKQVIGMLELWNFGWFHFVDHIAVAEQHRNKGYGEKILKEVMKNSSLLILESELPETPLARRRLDFYKRLGCKINPFGYIMPSYGKDKKPVKLSILSYPHELSETEFARVKCTLYENVYGKKPA